MQSSQNSEEAALKKKREALRGKIQRRRDRILTLNVEIDRLQSDFNRVVRELRAYQR